MGSADRITKISSGDVDAKAARMAAMRKRIRELNSAAAATRKGSDTDPDPELADNPESNQAAELARAIHRKGVGTIPQSPATKKERGDRERWKPAATLSITANRDDDRGDQHTSMLRLAPVWVVSAVFHAVLLIILGLLTYSCPQLLSTIEIAGDTFEPETILETPDDITLGIPDADMEEPLVPSTSMDLDIAVLDPVALTPSPDFTADWTGENMLSDQLSAVQKIKGSMVPRKHEGAQFYGIQATGDRFVFVVDSSTSMRLKFGDAKRELEYAVRGLRKDQLFYVIFFDRDAERLRLGKWNKGGTRYSLKSRPELKLVAANEENISGLVYWMNTIQLEGDTNPYPAVVYALRKLQPDAIFLLSDGEFNDGGQTEAFLTRENIFHDPENGTTPKTIVHCVGFYSRQGEITLQRIAEDNGGTYRFVEPPRSLIPVLGPAAVGLVPVR